MIENIFFPPNISLVCRTSLAVCHLSTTLSILHMEFYVALTAIRMMEIFFLVLLLLLAALFTTRSPISKPSQCHIPELSKKWSNVYIRCRFTFAIFYSKSQVATHNQTYWIVVLPLVWVKNATIRCWKIWKFCDNAISIHEKCSVTFRITNECPVHMERNGIESLLLSFWNGCFMFMLLD